MAQDIWSRWLLDRRFGGNEQQMKATLDFLYPIRDKVLDHAALAEGQTFLDVGCGDGLLAFGALTRTQTSRVIFSDISQDLLDHSQALARQMNVDDRCLFLRLSADDLSALQDASVDVVMMRSVLIYVDAKARAFREFYRVLKPGGRLAIFEPINRFGQPEPPELFFGYPLTPEVQSLGSKIKAVFSRLQPFDTDPMLNFDERDLLTYAEQAGFNAIHLDLHTTIQPPNQTVVWETVLRTPGNPRIPSLEEAMQQVLTPKEIEQFTAYLRPLVETNQGIGRSAMAYLWAVK